MSLTLETQKAWKCSDEQVMNCIIIALGTIYSHISAFLFALIFGGWFSHLGLSTHIAPLEQFEMPQDILCHIGLMRMSWMQCGVSDDSRHLHFRKQTRTLKLVTIRGKMLIYCTHRSNLVWKILHFYWAFPTGVKTSQGRKNIHKENQKENDWKPTCSQTIIFNNMLNREPRLCKLNSKETGR